MKNKSAFTLVEILVVVTILSILSFIGFGSFQSHSLDARNSARLENISLINKSLELFMSNNGYFPEPDNKIDIKYLAGNIFYQGNFGDNTKRILGDFSKLPVDPLTLNKYTYSVLENKEEFQIATVLEGTKNNISFVPSAYAEGNRDGTTYISGNYNGKILSVKIAGVEKILAIPSLISNDLSNTNIINMFDNNNITYNGLSSLPETYKNSSFINKIENKILVNTGSIEVFSGKFSDLLNNKTKQIEFLGKLQNAYNGTFISEEKGIKYILDTNILNEVIAGDTARRILSKSIFKNIKLGE